MPYPRNSDAEGVPASPDFPSIERGILSFWKGDDTFRASIAQREGADEFVFYDGPPFANGLPHYGHLLASIIKEYIPEVILEDRPAAKEKPKRGTLMVDRAKEYLGFEPKFPLDKGYRDYVKWYLGEWERVQA